jgi:hypothetical protein
MELNQAIQFAQVVNAAYAVAPDSLANSAGQAIVAGGSAYEVVTTIYASDLATDLNPDRSNHQVSIGLICQADGAGDVVIAIRGTEGILEWIHDAEFLLVPCPFLTGASHTEDGFTAMYRSLRTAAVAGSPGVATALATLPFKRPVTSVTICGHSLGGSLATLLALDLATNTNFKNPSVYTYASPRTGDSLFASTYDRAVKNTFRIANRLDLVPNLPLPTLYQHVLGDYELNPVQLLPIPPKILVKPTIVCEHLLDSYLHLLSVVRGGALLPLSSSCVP